MSTEKEITERKLRRHLDLEVLFTWKAFRHLNCSLSNIYVSFKSVDPVSTLKCQVLSSSVKIQSQGEHLHLLTAAS